MTADVLWKPLSIDVTGPPPSELDRTGVVALVPVGDRAWAAGAAVTLARSLARAGRRVFLCDLDLEAPRLHDMVGVARGAGVSDYTLYGASTTHVASEIEDRLMFVSAGTPVAGLGQVFASARWEAFFEQVVNARGLLLLFVPPLQEGAAALLDRVGSRVALGDPVGVPQVGRLLRGVRLGFQPTSASVATVDSLAPDVPVVGASGEMEPATGTDGVVSLESLAPEPEGVVSPEALAPEDVVSPESLAPDGLVGAPAGSEPSPDRSEVSLDDPGFAAGAFNDPNAESTGDDGAGEFRSGEALSTGALDAEVDGAAVPDGSSAPHEPFGLADLPEPDEGVSADDPAVAHDGADEVGVGEGVGDGGSGTPSSTESPGWTHPGDGDDTFARPTDAWTETAAAPGPSGGARRGGSLVRVAMLLLLVVVVAIAAGRMGWVDVPGVASRRADVGESSAQQAAPAESGTPEQAGEATPVEGVSGPDEGSTSTVAPAPAAVSSAPVTAPHQVWSLRIGAYSSQAVARREAAAIADRVRDHVVVIVPVDVDGRRWWRVMSAIAPDRETAEGLRTELGAALVDVRPEDWLVRQAPSAFLLDETVDFAGASAARAEWVDRGIDAYVMAVAREDGSRSFRVYAGAYAGADEAAAMRDLLVAAGVEAPTLVERRGVRPE